MAVRLLTLGCVLLSAEGLARPRSFCPPKPPTVSEFDVEAYLGKWYEQKRIPALFQLNTRCVRAEYGLNDEGLVTVHNVATKQDGEFDEIFGTAVAPDPAHPGELVVTFPGNPSGSYWVLETDYENYSIVYSCQDYLVGLIKLEFAWILAREQHLSEDLLAHALEVYEKNGIDTSQLEDTLHTEECYYGDP